MRRTRKKFHISNPTSPLPFKPDLTAAVRSGLKYAVLHILHEYEKIVKICKIWEGTSRKSLRMQLSPYVCSQVQSIFSYMFPCAWSQWSRRAQNSCGDVSYFACNQLGFKLLSLHNIACFRCEVFRCCLLSLQNIAFSASRFLLSSQLLFSMINIFIIFDLVSKKSHLVCL